MAVVGENIGRRTGRSRRVELARIVLSQCEAHENAKGGRSRYRDQKADEAEEVAQGEQREYHPNRIEMHASAYQVRRQDVVRQRLPDKENDRYEEIGVQFGQNCAIAMHVETTRPSNDPR